MMQMVSQIPMNIIFLAIGGKVQKYDLVSKDLLFEFSSFAKKNLILYDNDDKLIASDSKTVRLWDFFDHKEEVPELVTVLESPIRIDLLKVNRIAEKSGERKDVFYYVIACQNEFKIYHGRMDLLLEGEVNGMDKIRSIEFGQDTKVLYVGTEKGQIYRFDLPSPQEVEEEYKKGDDDAAPKAKQLGKPINIDDKKDQDYSVMSMYRLLGILETDVIIVHAKNLGIKVFTWNYDTDKHFITRADVPEYNGEIDYMRATPDG